MSRSSIYGIRKDYTGEKILEYKIRGVFLL